MWIISVEGYNSFIDRKDLGTIMVLRTPFGIGRC
jgi:hypothetical protein